MDPGATQPFRGCQPHFRAQIEWLRHVPLALIHFACYDDAKLLDNFETALARAVPGTECTFGHVKSLNTGASPDAKQSRLSERTRAWILKEYAEDASLWQTYCAGSLAHRSGG